MEEGGKYSMPTDIPVFFEFDADTEIGFFAGDLRKEDSQYYLAGNSGNIGHVVGSGKSVKDAQQTAFGLIPKIHSRCEIIYDPEIGDKFEFRKNFLRRNKII
jgi:phosphoribosylamine-glycine ligase